MGLGVGAAFALAASRVRQGSAPRRAAALRRTAAVPQVPATVQLDAIATLMRRTLIRTSAPIFNSLRRMVLHACKTNLGLQGVVWLAWRSRRHTTFL